MDTLSLTKEARIYNGEKTVSSINGAGKAREHCIKKIKLVHFLTQFNIGFLELKEYVTVQKSDEENGKLILTFGYIPLAAQIQNLPPQIPLPCFINNISMLLVARIIKLRVILILPPLLPSFSVSYIFIPL